MPNTCQEDSQTCAATSPGVRCVPSTVNAATLATLLADHPVTNFSAVVDAAISGSSPAKDGQPTTAPVLCVSSSSPVPEWIFVLGGLGIVAGLALYGKKILIAMGVKMTKITPSRGFAIDISAALVVVVGSRMSLPLSTTHCKVGATVGVGLVEGSGNVNKPLLTRIAVGWIVTLAITGGCSAVVYLALKALL